MFSELVDRAVHLSGRPDSLTDIVYYANETMRDMSKREDWDDDSCEATYDVPQDGTVAGWVPPEGRERFRREEYICYDRGSSCECEPTRVRPSRRLKRLKDYYYVTKNTFFFNGAKSTVDIYYYAYQPWLRYYPKGQRPAEMVDQVEQATEWNTQDADVIDLVSNWFLERHNHVVLKGTLARFYADKADPRQQVAYSAYEQGITHMIRSEGVQELLGRRHG